jgi:hypothetical protein
MSDEPEELDQPDEYDPDDYPDHDDYDKAVFKVDWLAAGMVLGACAYVPLNTGLISLVISLADRRPLREVWSSSYEWTLSDFLVGAAFAGLASAVGQGEIGA